MAIKPGAKFYRVVGPPLALHPGWYLAVWPDGSRCCAYVPEAVPEPEILRWVGEIPETASLDYPLP